MSLSAVPTPSEPLCEWLERGLREIAGQDPLGIQTITTDRILPALLPGVLALARRARYFSIYAFLLRRYEQNAGHATNQGLDDFMRHREFELGVAANLCPDCRGDGAVGNRVIALWSPRRPHRTDVEHDALERFEQLRDSEVIVGEDVAQLVEHVSTAAPRHVAEIGAVRDTEVLERHQEALVDGLPKSQLDGDPMVEPVRDVLAVEALRRRG